MWDILKSIITLKFNLHYLFLFPLKIVETELLLFMVTREREVTENFEDASENGLVQP